MVISIDWGTSFASRGRASNTIKRESTIKSNFFSIFVPIISSYYSTLCYLFRLFAIESISSAVCTVFELSS